ncbi:hypothetical protein R6Q59_008986 [Mikania micrantha]
MIMMEPKMGNLMDAKLRLVLICVSKQSRRGFLRDRDSQTPSDGSLTNRTPSFLPFGNLGTPTAKFQRIAQERDEFSRTVPSSTSQKIRDRLLRVFSKKIDWVTYQKLG